MLPGSGPWPSSSSPRPGNCALACLCLLSAVWKCSMSALTLRPTCTHGTHRHATLGALEPTALDTTSPPTRPSQRHSQRQRRDTSAGEAGTSTRRRGALWQAPSSRLIQLHPTSLPVHLARASPVRGPAARGCSPHLSKVKVLVLAEKVVGPRLQHQLPGVLGHLQRQGRAGRTVSSTAWRAACEANKGGTCVPPPPRTQCSQRCSARCSHRLPPSLPERTPQRTCSGRCRIPPPLGLVSALAACRASSPSHT